MAATRRRGAALVHDIQAAVLAEVQERGYHATTYDRVAERAGTSKPVLYRRWPTKAQMVLDALAANLTGPTVPPDTGSFADDLKALLSSFRSSVEASGRQTVLALLAEPGNEDEDAPEVRSTLFAIGADLTEPLVQRARRRGDLGDAPLPPALVRLPLDLARHELLVSGTLPDDVLATIVDEISVPLLTARSRGAADGERRGTRR